jgi:hypothetical protein
MKKLLKTISSLLNSIAEVRAASSLARMHKYEAATNVIIGKK